MTRSQQAESMHNRMPTEAAMSRPNILLITTDTQRTDTLACMGSQHGVSPCIDRLAEQGVLFEQGHTASPVCMPARVSLLTGYHTPIHGCIENGIARRTDLPVFTDALADAGYRNIMVGKAHFGPVPDSFHVQHIIHGEKGSDSDDFYARHIRSHGYSRSSAHPNPIPPELFMDAYLADTTIAEMDRARSDGVPFFAFCSMPSPHSPNDPPGEWATLFDDRDLPPINYADGEIATQPTQLRALVGTLDGGATAKEPASSYIDGPFESVREAVGNSMDRADPALVDRYRRLYYGLAAYCDAQVGRMIDYLDESGLRQNTLVIFTSDHGLQLFDHGFNDKHTFYDESWRIPFILSMPATLPQGERRGFAVWTDITATIVAAAGARMPSVQGYDLIGPLSRGEASPREFAVATLYRSVALATHRWKLVYYLDEDEGQLFDRREDPREQTNLYDDPAHRAIRDQLLIALLAWRSDIADTAYLHKHTRGGGPVANRIVPYVHTMRGTDPDRRLAERLHTLEDGRNRC
jgi:arylsulfatase